MANVPAEKKEKLPTTAQQMPDFMKGKQGAGTDNLDTSDMTVPRIKLLQAISPEVSEFENAKAGEFWHTLAEQTLGRELLIVPVYVDKRYILWRPRKAGGGILARADDGINWNPPNITFDITLPETKKSVKWTTGGDIVDAQGRVTAKNVGTVDASGLAEWGSYDPNDPNSQPAATLMYTLVIALPDYPDLGFAQLTLQRGSVRIARDLVGKLKISKAPSYGRVFRMSQFDDKNSTGDAYYNYRFKAEGFVSNPDHFNAYEALYKQFSETGLNIKDIDNLQEDDTNKAADVKTSSSKNY